jgi:hypothetical protein
MSHMIAASKSITPIINSVGLKIDNSILVWSGLTRTASTVLRKQRVESVSIGIPSKFVRLT